MASEVTQPVTAGKDAALEALQRGPEAAIALTLRRTPSSNLAPQFGPALLGVVGVAPIDEGFLDPDGTAPDGIDRGTVEVRAGSRTLDLSALQQPWGAAGRLKSVGVIAASLPLFPYLLKKLTLVRTGEIALVRSISGECRALPPGWHLLDTVTCEIRKASVNDTVVRLGPLNIIRVLPGQVGLATLNGHPLFLAPGVHLVNDPLFAFIRHVSMTQPHIEVGGVLHLITVQRGQLGLVVADSQGHFLGEGRHAINHPRFRFVEFASATEEHLQVGSKHRILIPAGRIGLAWESGLPLILEPLPSSAPRCIDSPTFTYDRSVSATQQVIKHGSLKVVMVRQGFVGVSFADGVLDVLPPGRHILKTATHAFAGFLPTGQQTLSLTQVVSMTSDNVGLEYDAVVTVQVVDAKKAIVTLGGTTNTAQAAAQGEDTSFNPQSLWDAICAKAKLALVIIIGNARLNRGDGTQDDNAGVVQPGRGGVPTVELGVAPAEAIAAAQAHASSAGAYASAPPSLRPGAGDHDPAPSGSAPSFKSQIHDTFMEAFAQSMLNSCGVAVIDMSVEDVRISDKSLAEAMARSAVARADLAKAGIEKQVRLTSSEAEKQSEILRAEGRARATAILAEAEAQRVRLLDDALASIKAPITQQREILLAAGEIMKASHATLVLTQTPADAASMLASTGAMATLRSVGGAAAM